MSFHRTFIKYLPLLLLTILFHSCVSHQDLINFNEGPEFSTIPENIDSIAALTIQPADALAINVEVTIPERIVPTLTSGSTQEEEVVTSYVVSPDGYITFPTLGNIKVAGLTLQEVKQLITEGLNTLQNPVVNVRLLNFRFTVLGEVNNPMTFTLPEEKVTLIEALGMAGDLTNYGNRANILIIREQDGKRMYGRVNLHSRQLFSSPYYYLRQNDKIYVEPTKGKTATISDQTTRILSWTGVAVTLLNLIAIFTIR